MVIDFTIVKKLKKKVGLENDTAPGR